MGETVSTVSVIMTVKDINRWNCVYSVHDNDNGETVCVYGVHDHDSEIY